MEIAEEDSKKGKKRPQAPLRLKGTSLLNPKAFFWVFAAGTTALASLCGVMLCFLALGRVPKILLVAWPVMAAFTSTASSLVAARVLAIVLQRQKTLEHFATVDELTGAPNRRVFAQQLDSEVDRCSRLRSALCVVFIDIDFFKTINDEYGHQIGDRVLRLIYSRLEEKLRLYDFVGRLGGDEFVMALPGTDAQTAFGVAERLRESVQSDSVPDVPRVTISLGVAELGTGMSSDQLIRNADMALYTAKNNGRNRTEVYHPPRGQSSS